MADQIDIFSDQLAKLTIDQFDKFMERCNKLKDLFEQRKRPI